MCLLFGLLEGGGGCFGNSGWVGVQTAPHPFLGGGMFLGAWVLMGSQPLSSLLSRCCLMAGCLGRQVSLLPIKGGGGRPGTQGVQEGRVGCKNKNHKK